MILTEYLERHKLSQNDFGRRIGAATGTVSRWVTGARRPSLRWLIAIEAGTQGWVTMEDFYTADRSGNLVIRGSVGQGLAE
jgi:transcriptional regulator with XRE-family HTH domain